MKIKKAASIGAVAAVALAGIAFTAAPASAEPTVATGGYTLAGSDTIQDVVDALVNGTTITGSSVRVLTAGVANASYDAFPNTGAGSYIQTKSGSAFKYFPRPSGSGDGINSMIASYNLHNNGYQWAKSGTLNIQGYVDIARSSGGPKTLDSNQASPAASDIAFIPFARDAVAYAYVEDSTWTQAQKDAVAALTQSQLQGLYNGTAQPVAGVTLRPLLPQSSSGTRKFFLGGTTGIALGSNNDPAGVNTTNGDNAKQENVATELTVPGEIIPFSAAGWIAQSNGAVPNNSIAAANAALGAAGTVKLGDPLAATTTVYTGSGSALVPTSAYYSNTTWGRNTYLVAPKSALTGSLATLLDPTVTAATSLAGYGTLPSTPGAVKTKFGFLAPLNGTTIQYALSSDTY